jgi:hypothetical protein
MRYESGLKLDVAMLDPREALDIAGEWARTAVAYARHKGATQLELRAVYELDDGPGGPLPLPEGTRAPESEG